MKSFASAVCLSCLVIAGTVTADDANKGGTPVGKETPPITITGCLLAGTQPDTFILKNVSDSVGQSPDVIYWLSTTHGLKDHVGQTIEVTGPVVAVSEGELEVKTNPAKSPDTTIDVKSSGEEAKARTTHDTGSGGRAKEERMMPVHRIKVRSVRMVAPTCS